MIRQQQLELQRLQSGQSQGQNTAIDDGSAISEKSGHGTPQPSTSQTSLPTVPAAGSFARSPGAHRPRNSSDLARADLHRQSRTPSRGASPRLRSTSISAESGDWVLGGRDESAFYQAETQMLVRENQMLRHRVRDLGRRDDMILSMTILIHITEKQLSEVSVGSPISHEPSHHSNLSRSATAAEEERKATTQAPVST